VVGGRWEEETYLLLENEDFERKTELAQMSLEVAVFLFLPVDVLNRKRRGRCRRPCGSSPAERAAALLCVLLGSGDSAVGNRRRDTGRDACRGRSGEDAASRDARKA
jgi:hypothetical protein